MILQELLEASTFRKRSTSQMTYGFEFEVIVDDIKEDYDEIVERIRNEHSFEEYVNENINDFNFEYFEPIYGFVSKEDLAEYNSKQYPQEKKLVNEILNLKDKNYQLFYLKMLTRIRNNIKIDNISDFDEYLNKTYSSKALEDKFENMKNNNSDGIIKNLISKYFLYFSELISKNKIFEYIYDEDNNVINVKDLNFSQLEDLFEDYEDIINDFESGYDTIIDEIASDELDEKEINVEEVLRQNNITNVKVINDESLGNDGVEIVTEKIYGIDEAIKQFKNIINLIQNEDKLYTNERTGLHINIGTWDDISKIDLTKLLVFSNETQILSNMERQENNYTQSLVKYIIKHLQHEGNLQNFNKIIRNMNEEILDNTDHTSFMDFEKLINNGYIEIRGFGNEDYEDKSDYIIKMIRYLSRIMEIASDPEEAKQQYIKKLYKIFNFDSDLSGEKDINFKTILTPTEIKYVTRFFSYRNRQIIKDTLENNKTFSIFNLFIEPLIQYDEKLTNDDLRILNKLLNNISLPPIKYYENHIKGKSDKIDNLFQKFY